MNGEEEIPTLQDHERDRDNEENPLLICLQNKESWQTGKVCFMTAIKKLNY